MEAIANKKRKATTSASTSPQDRSFETPDVKSNGRVRSSVSQQKFSPIRAGRLEEKHELQELNKRLEHYILWQRERDAAQNALQQELNVLRESFETEKRHLELQLQQERDQYKEKKDESASQLARLNEDVERHASLIEQQKRQLEKDQKTISSLKALNSSLSKENQTLKTKLATVESRLGTAEEDRKSAVEELEAEREEHERLKGDLAREQKRADELTDQVARERSRGDKNQELLESESGKSREWLTKYRELMAETSKSRQALEEELRKDFTNQLTDLIAHHDEISQKEKNEAIANLQAFHEQKAKEKTEALEQALKKADQLQAQIRDLSFREAVANREASSAKGIRDSLERTISDLNLKYSELDRKHKEEIEEKERIIDEFRTRINQQDDEFNTLMDVKIALAMEIKAYRLLLDSEEDRLELRTGTKGQEKKDATASVIISRMNPEATRITIRNGTTESADLKGWRLSSHKTTKEFIFPQFILPPGKTAIVHVGTDAESRLEKENELAWVADGVWNDEGDTALLFDPRGRQASRVNVIPSA